MEDQTKPTKDLECLHCIRFYDCKGKPPGVWRCLCYQERKDNKK